MGSEGVYEGDDWSVGGKNIISEEQLARVAAALESSVVIVEHRHYRDSRSPDRMFFEEYDEFVTYLKEKARTGDAFWIWSFDLCRESNAVAAGKYPDSRGRVPSKGAY